VGIFSLFSKKPTAKLKVIDIAKRFDDMQRTGQGSMSKVYRTRDRQLGRTVCLKVLDKEKLDKFRKRFPGILLPPEGAVLSALRHQNVVQVFDYGQTRARVPEECLVMEWIDGLGLNFLIETNSPHLKGKRVAYLTHVADGLEYIHQQDYMHRDICPRNIMVNQAGIVKIIDFGLALPNRPEFRKPGNRTGTPSYMAPELIRRLPTDHRVDLFALGVTAYEAFTKHLPWERTQSFETLMKHMNNPGKDPREFAPDLDEKLAKFLLKAIARDPKDRFQTAAAFREALNSLPRDDY
jgi:serine/threonine protein kinase